MRTAFHDSAFLIGIRPTQPYVQDLKDIFEKLELPAPEPDQAIYGLGNAGAVFMQQAGCVIRIVNNTQCPIIRHPNIMRPIGSIHANDDTYRIDFQFAGLSPITTKDADKLESRFEMDKLEIGDIHSSNACYIPNDDTPIMFDASFIKTLNDTTRVISQRLESASRIIDLKPQAGETPDLQDLKYADLRTKFEEMFVIPDSVSEIKVDKEAVPKFWLAMKEAATEGRLVASWLDQNRQKDNKVTLSKNVRQKSQSYDENLQAFNPVFAAE